MAQRALRDQHFSCSAFENFRRSMEMHETIVWVGSRGLLAAPGGAGWLDVASANQHVLIHERNR